MRAVQCVLRTDVRCKHLTNTFYFTLQWKKQLQPTSNLFCVLTESWTKIDYLLREKPATEIVCCIMSSFHWACRLFVCMFCGRSSAKTSSAVWKVRVCSRFPTLAVVQVHWWLVSSLIFAPLRVTSGRIFANIILDCCMNCNTLLTYKSSLSTVFV